MDETGLTPSTLATPVAARAAFADDEHAGHEAVDCLLEVTRELNTAPDLASGLARVADHLQHHIHYDTLAILLLDDLGRELRIGFAQGYTSEVTEHWRFGMGQGIVGTAAKTRRPIRVGDVLKDPRYISGGQPLRSELAIPLLSQDRMIGVLDVGSRAPDFFTAEHERLLATLGGHLASAIENARLYQNMREQARTLSLLHELSRDLTAILDRNELLQRVAVLVGRIIDFDLFTVLLWDEESQRLEPWLALFADGRLAPQPDSLPLGHGISGAAAALRQPIRVPNVHLDPRYVPCIADLDVLSELAVPLLFKDRLIGVLVLESAEYNAFSEHHEQLLSTLASSIAIALENARLYEKLREEEQRLESDLATAREVQKQLLPRAVPWVSRLQVGVGYEPARHLGGDFYDFLPYGPGRVAIALGDVAGKATSAALFGTLAVGILREYAVHHRFDPDRTLTDMNGKLQQLGVDNRFVAMAFACYDAERRTLILANSGLPYPLLLRGGRVEKLEVSGVPLGLLPGRTYAQVEVPLAPGDAVLLYSDGIEECRDRANEEFGAERVAEHLQRLGGGTADEIAKGLIEATDLFAAGAEPADDRTAVVIKSTRE